MMSRINITLVSAAALIALTQTARADLQICSRMSYVVEAAIAIEDQRARIAAIHQAKPAQ